MRPVDHPCGDAEDPERDRLVGARAEIVFDDRRFDGVEDARGVVAAARDHLGDHAPVADVRVVDPVRAEERVDDARIDAGGERRAQGLHRAQRMVRRHRQRHTEALRPALHVRHVVLRLRRSERREELLRRVIGAKNAAEQQRAIRELYTHSRRERGRLRRAEIRVRARVVEPEIE